MTSDPLSIMPATLTESHSERSNLLKRFTIAENMVSFLDLPSEIRNQIYELCLLHEDPIEPWSSYNPRQELTYGLLRTSKKIHQETSSLLYAQNCFDFTMTRAEDVGLFLGTIGHINAGHIKHIRIDFPNLRDLEPGNVALEEGSNDILINIRSGCANLSTLTTSLFSTNAMVLKLDALDYPKIVAEAVAMVDTSFRSILSVQTIFVEVYVDGLSEYIRSQMESHGWTFSAKENPEEWNFDRAFYDAEYDWDHDYGYDGSDNDDDYDIDNDSDFWRRAGD